MPLPPSVRDITAMSHRFAVKWSVPVKEMLFEAQRMAIPHIILSHIYRFKGITNLEFAFKLFCTDVAYEIKVDCEMGLPIFQDDALVLIRDRVHRVKCNPNNLNRGMVLTPLILAHNFRIDELVTFHCIISVPAKVVAEIPSQVEDEEGRLVIECTSILTDPGVHPHGYDDVSEFLFSSRIPDFDVDMATRFLGEAHQRKYPILKALSVEYLLENLATENVMRVLKKSIDCDAKDLSRRCMEFISQECDIVKRVKELQDYEVDD